MFSTIGISFDILSVVGVLWGRTLCGVEIGHSHAGPSSCSHGHSHATNEEEDDQKDLNVLAVVLHIAGDLVRSVALCTISIILYCDTSDKTASKVDAWTAMAICVVGMAFCAYVLYSTCRHYLKTPDQQVVDEEIVDCSHGHSHVKTPI